MDKKKGIDIINEVLEDCIMAYPVSSFIISLYKQYGVRGSLSKNQLQGLHAKASKIQGMSTSKLGTLEAIIKKMPTRWRKGWDTPVFGYPSITMHRQSPALPLKCYLLNSQMKQPISGLGAVALCCRIIVH